MIVGGHRQLEITLAIIISLDAQLWNKWRSVGGWTLKWVWGLSKTKQNHLISNFKFSNSSVNINIDSLDQFQFNKLNSKVVLNPKNRLQFNLLMDLCGIPFAIFVKSYQTGLNASSYTITDKDSRVLSLANLVPVKVFLHNWLNRG